MRFNVLDIQGISGRLLAAPSTEARTAIFAAELISPFEGLVKIMGQGMDGFGAFRLWGMWPEQYEGESRDHMKALLEELTRANAWERCQSDRTNPAYHTGYSGFGAIPGWAMVVYWAATPDNLRSIEAVTAHEMHHNILATLLPPRMNVFQIDVGEYMVMEGLAESFAQELYGVETVGPWVTQYQEAEMGAAIKAFRLALTATGFNTIRQYIFGDEALGIPHFAGYALGYKVVQAYLARTGVSVVDATFVDPATLIAESGVFAQ